MCGPCTDTPSAVCPGERNPGSGRLDADVCRGSHDAAVCGRLAALPRLSQHCLSTMVTLFCSKQKSKLSRKFSGQVSINFSLESEERSLPPSCRPFPFHREAEITSWTRAEKKWIPLLRYSLRGAEQKKWTPLLRYSLRGAEQKKWIPLCSDT